MKIISIVVVATSNTSTARPRPTTRSRRHAAAWKGGHSHSHRARVLRALRCREAASFEEKVMAFSLTWLPQVLLNAGLKVAEQPGWKDRGRGDVGPIKGVMCHHTAGAKTGNMPSLGIVTNGRPDLPG